jgi:hypothetical protein
MNAFHSRIVFYYLEYAGYFERAQGGLQSFMLEISVFTLEKLNICSEAIRLCSKSQINARIQTPDYRYTLYHLQDSKKAPGRISAGGSYQL